jgi:hypothetical protein
MMGKDFFEKEIYDRISDICISMKTEDWLELPERIDRNIDVRLTIKIQQSMMILNVNRSLLWKTSKKYPL